MSSEATLKLSSNMVQPLLSWLSTSKDKLPHAMTKSEFARELTKFWLMRYNLTHRTLSSMSIF